VQARLCELGFIEHLERMWPLLEWGVVPAHDEHAPHGPGCHCNSDSNVKVQYLRLLHNFFDCAPTPDNVPSLPALRALVLTDDDMAAWRACAGVFSYAFQGLSLPPLFPFSSPAPCNAHAKRSVVRTRRRRCTSAPIAPCALLSLSTLSPTTLSLSLYPLPLPLPSPSPPLSLSSTQH
jgi:hypothetical protein